MDSIDSRITNLDTGNDKQLLVLKEHIENCFDIFLETFHADEAIYKHTKGYLTPGLELQGKAIAALLVLARLHEGMTIDMLEVGRTDCVRNNSIDEGMILAAVTAVCAVNCTNL